MTTYIQGITKVNIPERDCVHARRGRKEFAKVAEKSGLL
jgi:hypothetical protein